MAYPVTYYCPQCETLVALERDGYLADKTVTPYPLEGWSYVAPTESFEETDGVDGVRFVCGESDGVEWAPRVGNGGDDEPAATATGADASKGHSTNASKGDATNASKPNAPGCGEPFYLSFVRHEHGREVEPSPEGERVRINPDPRASGPRGPEGPDGTGGGFW